jgi:hypothetical protein
MKIEEVMGATYPTQSRQVHNFLSPPVWLLKAVPMIGVKIGSSLQRLGIGGVILLLAIAWLVLRNYTCTCVWTLMRIRCGSTLAVGSSIVSTSMSMDKSQCHSTTRRHVRLH